MAKIDVVQAAKDAMAAAQDSALGGCYDSAFAEGVASVPANPPGSLSQADVDAAVAKAQADDVVAMNAAVAAVQSQLDAMSAKDNADVASIAALQAKIDQIKALLN
jgi:hypothetical protein